MDPLTKEGVADHKQLAARIASYLRSRPNEWGHGCDREKACLMEHASNRVGKGSAIFVAFRRAARTEMQKRGSSETTVAGWNDEEDRTVDDVVKLCEDIANG